MSFSLGTSPINHMSFFNDLALTCSQDKTVRIFRINQEKNGTVDLGLLEELHGHSVEVTCAIFLDSSLLVSTDLRGDLIVWMLNDNTFEIKKKFKICEGSVNSLCEIKPMNQTNGKTSYEIVCGCYDGYLRNVSISSDTLEITLKDSIFCSEYGVSSLSYLDGYLLTGGNNSKVNLYKYSFEPDTHKNIKLLQTYKNHKNMINDVCMIMGPDDVPYSHDYIHTMTDLMFASASSDKSVIIYTYGKDTHPDFNHPDESQHAPLTTQTLTFSEPVYKLTFDPISMGLTVAYGNKHIECFLPNVDGEFIKAELEEITE